MLKTPIIPDSCFIAPTATVVGDVTMGEKVSVYYSAVVRGDEEPISIGESTNIQDGCVVHTSYGAPTAIGARCTVGHNAILHGCTVGDDTLIGMGAIILDGAVIGSECIIGAGALVTGGTVIPDGMMALGSPAKVRRPLTDEEKAKNRISTDHYEAHRRMYKENET